MSDKTFTELVERIYEITEGIDDFDTIARIVTALKAGKQVVVINRNGKLTCYIEQG
jgi:hypothetical protein